MQTLLWPCNDIATNKFGCCVGGRKQENRALNSVGGEMGLSLK
jgi:hypothetical protein